ncbi:MAG TPA: hypothetical protein VK633_13175, partial [Verrucomicrobiae bacterium]|nr:hypothetical protein [Verrucomicrobiae bacterium]
MSLLLFTGAAFFWLKGNEYEERRKRLLAPPHAATNAQSATVDLLSTKSTQAQLVKLSQGQTLAADPRHQN